MNHFRVESPESERERERERESFLIISRDLSQLRASERKLLIKSKSSLL